MTTPKRSMTIVASLALATIVLSALPEPLAAAGANSAQGTVWRIAAKVNRSLRRVGRLRNSDVLVLTMGPYSALGTDQYTIVDEDTNTFNGTYTEGRRGSITLNPDRAEMETYLANLIEDDIGATGVSVRITKLKATARIKTNRRGSSISISLQIKFVTSGIYEGEFLNTTGTFAVKGKGTPQ